MKVSLNTVGRSTLLIEPKLLLTKRRWDNDSVTCYLLFSILKTPVIYIKLRCKHKTHTHTHTHSAIVFHYHLLRWSLLKCEKLEWLLWNILNTHTY